MVVQFNHFAAIAVGLHEALADVVSETTVELGAAIRGQIAANGQIDTGFMYSSVYTVTKDGSTYGQADTPPGDSYLLPEETISGDMEGVAAVAANYGGYQNYGTRYLPARPFLEPAVDLMGPVFDAKLGTVEGRIEVV